MTSRLVLANTEQMIRWKWKCLRRSNRKCGNHLETHVGQERVWLIHFISNSAKNAVCNRCKNYAIKRTFEQVKESAHEASKILLRRSRSWWFQADKFHQNFHTDSRCTFLHLHFRHVSSLVIDNDTFHTDRKVILELHKNSMRFPHSLTSNHEWTVLCLSGELIAMILLVCEIDLFSGRHCTVCVIGNVKILFDAD